jgi:hypothetical protein
MSLQLVMGSNQFAEVATNFDGAITDYPITVVTGVKITDGSILGVLTWYGNSGAANVWIHALYADGVTNNAFVAQSRNTLTDGNAIGSTDPATVQDLWTTLAARHTNSTLRHIFVNGAQEGENTAAHLSGTENRFSVGHFGDATPSNPASAIIAFVAVFNTAVSDADIQAMATGTDPNTVAGLVELWDFTQEADQYVGLIDGVTLVPSGSPTFVSDAPDFGWLAVNQDIGAVDTLPVIFLDDVTPVPGSAVFNGGGAFAPTGERYVALFPGSGTVVFNSGLAYRTDGALVINPAGVIAAHVAGIGCTAIGEVVAVVDTPTQFINGWPCLDDGTVCMSEVS